MNEKQRILNLLKEGRITSEEAVMLLEAIEEPAAAPRGNPNWGGEFSRVTLALEKALEKSQEKSLEKSQEKSLEKSLEKSQEKALEKSREKALELSHKAAEIAREAARIAQEDGIRAGREGARIAREITRVFKGPTPPTPPTPPMAPNPPVVVVYGDEEGRPEGLRWVTVSLDSGDLEVRSDPSLEKPIVRGDLDELNIKEDGQNIKVNRHHGHRRKGSTKFLGMNITWDFDEESGGEPEIVLPGGWGVDLKMQSGDLSVQGVEYVRGEVMSGDVSLEGVGTATLNVYSGDVNAENLGLLRGAVYSGDVSLENVRGIDLEISSGDLSAELLLTEGQHRLSVVSGDTSLQLGGSSVRLEGRVGSGELHTNLELTRQKRSFSGTLGGGAALLKINVNSGDLTLEGDEAEGEGEA